MRTIVLTILSIAAFPILAQTPNPYAAVAQRNVFGLRTPAMVIQDSPTPVVSVKLFGVADRENGSTRITLISTN